ncbi:MAG: hypothetical protein HGB03_04020 [Candidatus Yonathbacteria bacterium]|nr:hypothetical protein [Candidatus Yonathbacteria bacterium]NTW47601.1 hypothetical protein [Candidatus Yonathbacteria bacterium]
MEHWKGPHEYPSLDTAIDARTERFTLLYGKLRELLSGPELGQGAVSFGRDMDRLEWEADATIEDVLNAVEDMYSPKDPKGVALKIELLRTFVDELKVRYGHDHTDVRAYTLLGRARAFLSGYMPLEYEGEDTRQRKTDERAVSQEVKDIVYGLREAVKSVPEGAELGELGISPVAFEAMLGKELEEMYVKGTVHDSTMKEALGMFMTEAKELGSDENTDPDGRWASALIAVEHFCETHFPGMIVDDEDFI